MAEPAGDTVPWPGDVLENPIPCHVVETFVPMEGGIRKANDGLGPYLWRWDGEIPWYLSPMSESEISQQTLTQLIKDQRARDLPTGRPTTWATPARREKEVESVGRQSLLMQVVHGLDAADPTHWTDQGRPRLGVINNLLHSRNIKETDRAELNMAVGIDYRRPGHGE